jgi:hypothetical protein
LDANDISLLDPLLACQRRLDQALEELHWQVHAANKSLLDMVLAQDKPARTTDIASSSAMAWTTKKTYFLYTCNTKILDILSDGENGSG